MPTHGCAYVQVRRYTQNKYNKCNAALWTVEGMALWLKNNPTHSLSNTKRAPLLTFSRFPTQLQGPPAGTLLSSCATVLTAHMGQLSPDAVVLCLHGFTRAGVVSDSLHRALWGQLAASRWQQLAPKQVTLALWAAAVSRQHPGVCRSFHSISCCVMCATKHSELAVDGWFVMTGCCLQTHDRSGGVHTHSDLHIHSDVHTHSSDTPIFHTCVVCVECACAQHGVQHMLRKFLTPSTWCSAHA